MPIFRSDNEEAQPYDLNQDRYEDIIWAGGGRTINVGIGDGSGHFRISYYGAAKRVRTFAVADFDGDSKPDIAVPGARGSKLSLLLNKGDGKRLMFTHECRTIANCPAKAEAVWTVCLSRRDLTRIAWR